jgi:hypothetical protein
MKSETIDLKDFRAKRNRVEIGTAEVKVPELAKMLDTPKDVIPIIQVKQASLSEQLTASSMLRGNDAFVGFLDSLSGILAEMDTEEAGDKKKAAEAIASAAEAVKPSIHPDAAYEISLCLSCVVSPKFTKTDIVWIAKHYPRVINKLAKAIQQLTIRGAQKKTIKP